MAEPGWIPPPHPANHYDECLRMAFSCVTGIHPRKLRYITTDQDDRDFWAEWATLARRLGYGIYHMFEYYGDYPGAGRGPWPVFDENALWIATVRSYHCRTDLHAIVMKGQKLHYDCSDLPRSRRPTKVVSGYSIVPIT